jgi:dipeptidyl aminopeptidase/acylaminoacyl peptidase
VTRGLIASLAACLWLAGCSEPSADSSAWETVETTTNDGAIVIEKVSYRSAGLRIFGQVCRPVGEGPYPLIVLNHGGVDGIGAGEWNGGICADAARQGYVQIESSYRGEDGSEGAIELCAGEVDDVLRMLDIALELPEVDPSRVAMWGGSHGGCVTTRAVQKGARVTAAADVFGITNLTTLYAFWQVEVAAGRGPVETYRLLIAIADAATGGPPEEYPEAYAARSPVAHADDLPDDVPFMITQGTLDPLVPPSQSCELGVALGLAGHHYDASHALVGGVPAGCEGQWTPATTNVDGFPASRYLLVYDGLGHAFDGTNGFAMVSDVAAFLIAKALAP